MNLDFDIYKNATALDMEQFGECFASFREKAFRLELLPEYKVKEEATELRQFASDERIPSDIDTSWSDYIRECTKDGRLFQRVRLEPNPITTYYRYEVLWAYNQNVKAGEDIRVILLDDLRKCSEQLPFLIDYWLFDDSRLVVMNYDLSGRFLGGVDIASELTAAFAKATAMLVEISTPINPEYFEKIRRG